MGAGVIAKDAQNEVHDGAGEALRRGQKYAGMTEMERFSIDANGHDDAEEERSDSTMTQYRRMWL